MTILVSCHHWPIQPRVGIHRLELNQAGVIWRQKIGSKLWNRKSRNSPNVSKNILRSIINMLTSNYKRRKCLVVSQRPMEWHFEMCVSSYLGSKGMVRSWARAISGSRGQRKFRVTRRAERGSWVSDGPAGESALQGERGTRELLAQSLVKHRRGRGVGRKTHTEETSHFPEIHTGFYV